MKKKLILMCTLMVILFVSQYGRTQTMGTAFTYQGQLTDGDSHADNYYDFEFRIFDSLTGGAQLDGVVFKDNVDVRDGRFTVPLDFGTDVLDGDARWLEIRVRPGASTDPGDYITLSPRQKLNPAPYALYALTGPGSTGFWSANNNHIYNTNTGYVGIGTDNPLAHLHIADENIASVVVHETGNDVVAQLQADTQYVTLHSAFNHAMRFKINDVTRMKIEHTGNIGVGTSTPGFKFDVAGDINFTGNLYQNGSLFSGSSLWTPSGSNIYFDTGNVGVGTDNPTAKFHSTSSDSTAIYGYASGADNYSGFFSGGKGFCLFGSDALGGHLLMRGMAINPLLDNWGTIEFKDIYDNLKGRIISRTSLFGHMLQLGAGTDIQMSIFHDNRVGIGTFIPGAQLHVMDQDITLPASAFSNEVLIIEDNDAVLGLYSNTGGSYGSALALGEISDGALTNKWGMYRTTGPDSQLRFSFGPDADYNSNPSVVTFDATNGIFASGSSRGGRFTDSNQGTSISLAYGLYGIWSLADRNYFLGNVGINNSLPACELDVSGKILASELEVAGRTTTDELVITGGSDLAEPFKITDDQPLTPGALVVIDDQNPGALKLSQKAYDLQVAGIVSGAGGINPGLILSQTGITDQGVNIALTGRVYAHADCGNGPIKPGDMLTTSNIPGHAMKATDRQRSYGAVIGKAMSSLDSGSGLVLVLVNLQ